MTKCTVASVTSGHVVQTRLAEWAVSLLSRRRGSAVKDGRERVPPGWPRWETAPHPVKAYFLSHHQCPSFCPPGHGLSLCSSRALFWVMGHLGGRWADLSRYTLATTALSTSGPSPLPHPHLHLKGRPGPRWVPLCGSSGLRGWGEACVPGTGPPGRPHSMTLIATISGRKAY